MERLERTSILLLMQWNIGYIAAIISEQRRNPAIAIATILAGQLHDGPGESILVFALCQLIALRTAWLLHQPARSALTQALFLSMIHRTTPSFRA